MRGLYTEGGEIQYLDGRDYIGYYHLMPNGTPMAGTSHSNNEPVLKFNPNRASISLIDPASFLNDGFELQDQSIIPSFEVDSFFDPTIDKIEFFIYDANRNLRFTNPNFKTYRVENNKSTSDEDIEEILLNPKIDISDAGYDRDTVFAFYNFISPEISDIFISEISSDRTEIRLQSNILSSEDIREEVTSLKSKIDTVGYFDEFYLNLGSNNYYICVNIQLDTTTTQTSFLVKLYEPLPSSITTKTGLEIVSKVSETLAYEISFPDIPIPSDNLIDIKGPNINLKIKDNVNNSTEFKNLEILTTSSFTSSLAQSEYLLSQSGISLNVSYSISDYDDFVHFSSAKQRLENFYYKAGQIESFQNSINSLRTITGTTLNSPETSASIHGFNNQINETIRNFDGFEYFLYFNSGSNAYPKSNSTAPYILQSTGSTEVLTWLGSDNVSSPFYGGALFTASRFDEDNPNWLYYTIPEFIRENPDNNNYIEFSNMIGQHFDDIWLYIRSITNKLRATNDINTGIAPEIVEETLKSFGYDVYGNNFDNNNIFTGLIGINDSGSFFPSTENEVINTFVSASNEPVPINDVSKEIYKRLYHNLVYLAKRKGTISGLRSLINIWGLPDTVLRIYEFGGKDRVNTNDWDLYRRIFNKALTISGSKDGIITDFSSETLFGFDYGFNHSWDIDPLVPRTIEYRFKSDLDPNTLPFQPDIRQSTFYLKQDRGGVSFDTTSSIAIVLEYNGSGSASGSFSGSAIDPQNQFADLTLYVSGSTQFFSSSINLPFLNQDWWNVMLHYDSGSNEFELYAGNKIYNGNDGTKLGFTGSTSITVPAYVDTLGYRTGSQAVIGRSATNVFFTPEITGSSQFSGSIQEVRYWANLLSESFWYNHIMNPLSIENGVLTGSNSPVETLMFRTREGEDSSLVGAINTGNNLNSIHPKVTGSFPPTSSFRSTTPNSYNALGVFDNNIEIQFLNNPNVGIKNRITDKIHVYNNVAYENVLSPYRTIQQNYEASQSFTEDTNLLQVAFSPQDEINDDIIHELGFNNQITEQIADPRNLSSSLDYYDGLRDIALKYFEKYIKADPNDYFRLIKYIDNSLFKAIKNYVPARTSVSTGIVIKQHLLERNRVRPPQVNPNTTIAITPEGGFNTPLTFKDITISGSVKSQPRNFTTGSSIQVFGGGTGGSFEKFNTVDFSPLGPSGSGPVRTFGFDITQSFTETFSTLSGSVTKIVDNQDEFYNGEFSGSQLTITTQSLNPGCERFLNIFTAPTFTSSFDYFVYDEAQTSSLAKFNNANTAPNSGEMFLNKVSAAGFLRNLKLSTTNKEGNDITNILDNATRLNFDFGTSLESFNVTKVGQGSGYVQFDIDSNFHGHSNSEFVLSSSYEDYPFLASASIAQSQSLLNDTGSGVAYLNGLNETIAISQYSFESDTNNLFNTSSGIYSTPQTPNLPINFTGSVIYSGSIISDATISNQTFNLILKLKSSTTDTFIDTFTDLITSTINEFSGSFTVSGSFNTNVPVKGENLSLELEMATPALFKPQTIISGSVTASNALFQISTGSLLPNPKTTVLASYEPYDQQLFQDFERHIDCQPLFNNIIDNRLSTLYFDVDYTSGLLNPINILPIINRNAEFFPIPDSNYTSQRSILPRYNGSKLNGLFLNKFSPSGTPYTENNIQKIWGGDSSFGKKPVIEQTKAFFGFFQLLVPTSPELEFATQAKLKYIIGIDGTAYKPIPKDAPSFYDVEGTFEQGNIVDISLDDTLQTDDPSLTNAAVGINLDNFNKKAGVIKGARRIDPIITTQKVSIYDVSNANDAFESTIEVNNPLNISTDYTTHVYRDILSDITGAPQRVDFTVEAIDNSNSFNLSTDEFTFPEDSQSPVKFEGQVFLVNDQSTSQPAVVRLVRERSGARIALSEEIFTIGANSTEIKNFESPPQDFELGDKIYVRVSMGAFSPVNVADNSGFTIPPGNFRLSLAYLRAIPTQIPTISVSGPFFTTGSNYTNQLTGSVSMSMILGQTQEPYTNTTFKPINEPFTIQVGDEFRIQGREDRVFLVNKVTLNDTSATSTGSMFIQVEPKIPPLINLDQFLIRRYNPDGTSVLIDMIPPSSSFTTTKGLIKNEFINEKLEENINDIIAKLAKEGTI